MESGPEAGACCLRLRIFLRDAVPQPLLAEDSAVQKSGETVYVQMDFPRFAYKAAAESGWRQAVKKNGMKAKDILKQWL